ncbi:uncharacterized protein LOC133337338 [Musca vetustissima]|uniref:uncharacterized protein LOC133337338 n=1 Tax=Musca vetustissima TaxID=27455 RepID=UPI002AB7BC76|nr:uncharacterized protein LOC133337338 [Musca vetustissima]
MDSNTHQVEQHNLNVTNDALPQICDLCHESINDRVVSCSSCKMPYHESCSRVSYPDEKFTCSACTQNATKYRRSAGSTQSSWDSKDTISSKRALELKRLHEERELAKKRDQDYLSKKYQILQEMMDNGESPSSALKGQVTHDVTATQERPTMDTEVEQMNNPTAKSPSSCAPIMSYTAPLMTTTQSSLLPNNFYDTNTFNATRFVEPIFNLHSTSYQNPNHRSTSSRTHQQSFINSAPTDNSQTANFTEQISRTQRKLTADQLHSRQTVPKELPLFSGSPDEWPLFSSTYDWSTQVCGLTDAENLIRLQRALRGEALESVKRILIHPSCVPHAISILRVLYGQPEKILFSLKNKIKALPPVNPNKMDTITNFAVQIKGLQSTIEACGLVDELNNSSLLQELVAKLPSYFQINWGSHKLTLQQNGKNANLLEFSAWIFDIGLSASTVNIESSITPSSSSSIRKQKNSFVHTHVETKLKKCLICEGDCVNTVNCQKFINAERRERWDIVKKLQLCKQCLKRHSGVCFNKNKFCNFDGCQIKHHYLLHGDKRNNNKLQHNIQSKENDENEEIKSAHNVNSHNINKPNILFKILPIKIYGNNNKSTETYAFLDDGSSVSLIEEDILEQLDLKGESDQLCMTWTANLKRTENNSQRLSIKVSGDNNKQLTLDVRSVKELMLPKQSINYELLCRDFAYLRGLPVMSYFDATPKILIGLNNASVTNSQRIRERGIKEPIAMKTPLGWTIFGPCCNDSLMAYNMHICECTERDDQMQQLIKMFYNIESLGISCHNTLESKEDERSMEILKNFTKQRDDGHYETALLWRYDNINMPNNYEMAKRRLICLENKLQKNRELFETFSEIIAKYACKGFISKIDISTKHTNVWYLPIFPVFNRNKPAKCRIVWDAAAKFEGISLNSMLNKGPDLLSSLPAILFKFREKSVAICGDIEQMFHQIYIREEDRHVQRFLWRNCEVNREPDVYIMNVMIFGASCAPCISQYVKNINALQFETQFPQAAAAVKDNHYVDDFLYSTDSVDKAVEIAKQTQYIQSKGGFNLRNWCSNKSEVVNKLDNKELNLEKQLNVGTDNTTEKVLGVFWKPADDTIIFKISPHIWNNDLIREEKPVTKRLVLKVLMTIYDPLGLIGNFLMYLKIILQEIWKSGVDWDQPIQNEQYVKWRKWLQYLPELEQISIPRCYLQTFADYENADLQLHTFVDASENGYAAVAYLRISQSNNTICSLIGSKTRVAPLRMTSIPRLELMAALIGARFANNIIKQHSIPLKEKHFWSDSRTVLSWLTHNSKKYHQFVALRISEILESTEINEWHWVPGKQNVADEATKWARRPNISNESRWLKGPPFLLEPKCKWPIDTATPEPSEVEARISFHNDEEILISACRFSKWNRMLRSLAYVVKFKNILKKNYKVKMELTSQELFEAECLLFKIAQQEFYANEIHVLKSNKNLTKSSSLYKLSPIFDENGILRVDGRIGNANIPQSGKTPIILPRGSRITFLLISHIHSKLRHQSQETVVNELRQMYYIPRMRVVVKDAVKQCQECKIKKCVPVCPQMAKLPPSRLSAFCSPFTYTGVDYFGPVMVTVGRHTEKRYGALFTCLTLRAVHIEVVNTLNTSSCIMAIRNFISRRGTPREFYSDNGTNFVSAEREFRVAVNEMDKNEFIRNFTTATTMWKFNPPSSPHMGGAWERLVRSVKTVLYNITPSRAPTEELLRSMLAEVENIINSRPLVYVPIDHQNAEALTPNHLLLGSSNGMKPLASYNDSGVALRSNWLCSQQYADAFWRRWVREYLPCLTLRSKWHEKAKPLNIGDLVIVVDPSNPRNTALHWAAKHGNEDVIKLIAGTYKADVNARTYMIGMLLAVLVDRAAIYRCLETSPL